PDATPSTRASGPGGPPRPALYNRIPRNHGRSRGVSDGTRTHDRLDHNQELYQLSYAHRGAWNLAVDSPLAWALDQRWLQQRGCGRWEDLLEANERFE